MEAAAAFEHGIKRPAVAATLRKLTEKRFPDDGYVAFYMARYLDYDANQAKKAGPYYKRAIKLMPNNSLVIKEYLMYLDMAMRDQKGIEKLLRDRKAKSSSG